MKRLARGLALSLRALARVLVQLFGRDRAVAAARLAGRGWGWS